MFVFHLDSEREQDLKQVTGRLTAYTAGYIIQSAQHAWFRNIRDLSIIIRIDVVFRTHKHISIMRNSCFTATGFLEMCRYTCLFDIWYINQYHAAFTGTWDWELVTTFCSVHLYWARVLSEVLLEIKVELKPRTHEVLCLVPRSPTWASVPVRNREKQEHGN